jgi:hypothetical protein
MRVFATKITDPIPHGMFSVATGSLGGPAFMTAAMPSPARTGKACEFPIS